MNHDVLSPRWMARAKRAAGLNARCPRASSACLLYNVRGDFITEATNGRTDRECNCNSSTVDTNVAPGTSCLALHAEVAAVLQAAKAGRLDEAYYAVTTRAPCRNCLGVLLSTGVKVLIVSDDWPDRDGTHVMWVEQGRSWWRVRTPPALERITF